MYGDNKIFKTDKNLCASEKDEQKIKKVVSESKKKRKKRFMV